ncbi:MAG TPA: hypothetical protein VGQ90_07740 [Stellaceae bacterium]|nr:hypothetical protein [Stellaceae bacterium]
MRRKIGIAALAMAMATGMTTGMAMAGEQEVVSGVTILRGINPTEQNLVNQTNGPTIGSSSPEVAGTYTVDVNGRLKQMSIGSSVPPGWAAAPLPEAGR